MGKTSFFFLSTEKKKGIKESRRKIRKIRTRPVKLGGITNLPLGGIAQ